MEKVVDDCRVKWSLLTSFSNNEELKEVVFQQLIAQYSTPNRFYHNLQHLAGIFLLNDDFSNRSAKGFATRLVTAVGSDTEKQIDLAYRIAFSRLPDAEDAERAMKFMAGQ